MSKLPILIYLWDSCLETDDWCSWPYGKQCPWFIIQFICSCSILVQFFTSAHLVNVFSGIKLCFVAVYFSQHPLCLIDRSLCLQNITMIGKQIANDWVIYQRVVANSSICYCIISGSYYTRRRGKTTHVLVCLLFWGNLMSSVKFSWQGLNIEVSRAALHCHRRLQKNYLALSY